MNSRNHPMPNMAPMLHIANMPRMRGISLVSLMVAMVVGLLVSLAAVSTLSVSRISFNTVDTASQMQDNMRLARQLIQRIVRQAGFKDLNTAAQGISTRDTTGNIAPNVMGFDNANPVINSSTGAVTAGAITAGAPHVGSDVLILRYEPAENFLSPGNSDGSMIDCLGSTLDVAPKGRTERRSTSIFFVDLGSKTKEPNLKCQRIDTNGDVSDAWSIVQGVEQFQVLYGVDASSAAPNTAFSGTQDSTPKTYLRADQFVVDGNQAATFANWRRVRSVRIGMVLRGPPHSQAQEVVETLFPLGQAMSNADDVGSSFNTPDPPDGRLRKTLTFTVHLRNDQDSALNP